MVKVPKNALTMKLLDGITGDEKDEVALILLALLDGVLHLDNGIIMGYGMGYILMGYIG